MKKILTIAAASLVLLSSCRSTEEGAVNGAMLGSMAGRAIGGITNGYYGEHIGSLVGMVAGGAAGAAVGHAEETKREKRVAELHRKHIERERRMAERQQRMAERQRRKAATASRATIDNTADDLYSIGGSSVAQRRTDINAVDTISVSSLHNGSVTANNTQYVGTYNVSSGTYTPNGAIAVTPVGNGQATASNTVTGKLNENVTIDKPTETTVRKDDESGFDPTNSGDDVIDFE